MKRSVGLVLLVLAFLLLVYIAVSAVPYARAHPQLDSALLGQYASPWPVVLTLVVAVTGLVLTVIPIRRGERWAAWLVLATFLTLLGTRLSTDPRCLVVLDPHQHGCHTFMIAVVLGIVGLALCALEPPPSMQT